MVPNSEQQDMHSAFCAWLTSPLTSPVFTALLLEPFLEPFLEPHVYMNSVFLIFLLVSLFYIVICILTLENRLSLYIFLVLHDFDIMQFIFCFKCLQVSCLNGSKLHLLLGTILDRKIDISKKSNHGKMFTYNH